MYIKGVLILEKILSIFTTENLISILEFIAKPLVIFIVCKILVCIAQKVMTKILSKTKLDKGIQGFIKSATKIAIWTIALIIIADSVGVNTASLVALVSVISLALSLSVQNLMTNIFSGITILISRPFKVGDYVEINGVGGTVTSIGLMRTVLVTPDKKEELIPNGDIASQRITNYSTEPIRRVEVKVSVSYDAETEDVKEAIREVLKKDSRIILDDDHKIFIRICAYNPNDIEYVTRMWVKNSDYWDVYYDTLENIRTSFNKNKIQFSFPHIIVHDIDDNEN